MPGFCLISCREVLSTTPGRARSVSLDLHAQWQAFESTGQFRFTPPTHALLAFAQALRELRDEGGVGARAARYRESRAALLAGMQLLGFREYLPRDRQSDVITSFCYPEDPRFKFENFYQKLSARGSSSTP